MLGLFLAFCGVSLTDEHFRSVVTMPDNVPIVGMIFLIIFFTWLSLRKAVDNDIRMERGEPTFEASESKDKLYTWPHLVYIELLCMIIATIVLVVWAIYLKAPLEAPANPTVSPNPSKAPWYFLGLQEMLVYFDPWIAGVLLPSMIIIGLMAIPYIDRNPKGSGYFSFKERKWIITGFLFGFLILWIFLIILGTFLRGPNWNFFGPYEFWDVHKVVPLVNVNLSELIWVKWLGAGLPKFFLQREIFGLVMLALYFGVMPLVLAKTVFRKLYMEMGMIRYSLFIIFLLVLIALPVKMYLRWMFNLKYIVAVPEYFFNI
ncbi:MAG: cytochrome C [Candidatus Omnitrophica bacterium]|nr:cytochrome C [Candidatus Omnitrophota bacterium]